MPQPAVSSRQQGEATLFTALVRSRPGSTHLATSRVCRSRARSMNYATYFGIVGPCESWPEHVIEAFCANVCHESVWTITKFSFDRDVPLNVLIPVLEDLPFGSASFDLLRYAEDLYRVWSSDSDESDLATPSPPSSTPEGSQPQPSPAGLQGVGLPVVVLSSDDDGEPTPTAPEKPAVVDVEATREPTTPPLITIVDLGASGASSSEASTSLAYVGPDLNRPEVLQRLGPGYVSAALSKPDRDPFDAAWKDVLRHLGPPQDWPHDMRQCFAGRVDSQNVMPVATFADVNHLPVDTLCEYLSARPQGIDSATVAKIRQYYEMWSHPTRGHSYRAQRFAYSLQFHRYLDLNLHESASATAKRLN